MSVEEPTSLPSGEVFNQDYWRLGEGNEPDLQPARYLDLFIPGEQQARSAELMRTLGFRAITGSLYGTMVADGEAFSPADRSVAGMEQNRPWTLMIGDQEKLLNVDRVHIMMSRFLSRFDNDSRRQEVDARTHLEKTPRQLLQEAARFNEETGTITFRPVFLSYEGIKQFYIRKVELLVVVPGRHDRGTYQTMLTVRSDGLAHDAKSAMVTTNPSWAPLRVNRSDVFEDDGKISSITRLRSLEIIAAENGALSSGPELFEKNPAHKRSSLVAAATN